jgi:hypothetical protein
MRIRIVQRPSGRIDGVPLDRFEPGGEYDVNASIGTYLIVMGYAQAVADSSPAQGAGARSSADDRPRKKRS